MLPLEEYATIPADSTIREALIELDTAQLGLDHDRHHHRAVLVLDEDGSVVGKLSHWAILKSLQPRFLRRDDLASLLRAGLTQEFVESMRKNFTGVIGSLEQMCRASASIKAGDAMVSTGRSVDEDALLIEAINDMVLAHEQSKLVTRNGEVVGILRLSDVFERVADMIRGSDPD